MVLRIITRLIVIIICLVNCQSKISPRTITFCVPPAAPLNGRVSIGSVVTRFSCNSGHKLDGSPVAVCVGGKWSTNVPLCVAATGKSKKTTVKGEMDVELKDQQIVTAFTHYPNPSQTDRSKSKKRKSRWKKRRRKSKRKKSKGKNSQTSISKSETSSQKRTSDIANTGDKKATESKRGKLSKKERRMRRRQERKRSKKRKGKKVRKRKRKHRKRKKIRDKNRNEIKIEKHKKKNAIIQETPEKNSIHFDGYINMKEIENGKKVSGTQYPKEIQTPLTTPVPRVIQSPRETQAPSIIQATKSMKPDMKNHLNNMYGIYNVNVSEISAKVDIVPTQTPSTDLLKEIMDRMKSRRIKNDSNLLDDSLILKVEKNMKKLHSNTNSVNKLRSNISEDNGNKKYKNSEKEESDYENEYDPAEFPDYSDSNKNSSINESSTQQELPVGYPSLEDRLYGRYEINAPRKRFIEEEDIDFTALDTTCTISGVDSIYLQPPRIPNGHVTAYITVTNPAPPNNVYVESNYDCNFGYQLSEPINSRLFCRKKSWIGVLPKCSPYIITNSGICGEKNGGCQHICSAAENSTFICSCYRGFTLHEDKESCQDVDECATNNGDCEGACFNKIGSYQCYCPHGYRMATNGKSCIDKNECILRNGHGPCQDTCYNTKGSYYCTCDGRPGTTLASDNHTCEDLNECSVDNGGCSHICLNTFGQTFCGCPDGYILGMNWKTCTDIDECDYPDIAKECDLGCINTLGSYKCAIPQDSVLELVCPNGEKLNSDGDDCEDIDECINNNFGCSHTCVNDKGSAHCECPPHYDLKYGKSCIDIDECKIDKKCSHECVNTDGSFKCECPQGRILSPDHITCIDLNECVYGNGGCQQICANLDGSHRCECQPGFVLMQDHTCEDVDECQQNIDGCDQICNNEPGTFSCACNDGYDQEGSKCIDIDECDINEAKCEQICSNTNGSYNCFCYDGYDLNHDGISCRDVDECSIDNPCSNFCSNKNGSFVCSCPVGWDLIEDGRTCIDIDECEDSKCSHGCLNTKGGYICACPDGLRLIDEGTSKEKTHLCVDIDECSFDNGNCSHICNNLEGSFECSCPEGLQIVTEDDISDCNDLNECEDRNGGCSHQCINEYGSFKCECPRGLSVSKGEHSCDDIDECLYNNGGCSHTCINLQGTYECTCPAGWEMNMDYYNDYDSNEVYFQGMETAWKICDDIDECNINNGGCSHECTNEHGSYHCSCPTGYNLVNDYTCEDINECMVDTGPCSSICINVPGTFRCECATGFELIDGTKCHDLNECFVEDICSHDCVNQLGTYKCLCPAGLVMEQDNKTCNDVNECGNSNGGCSHICVNTDGLYICRCPRGMLLANDLHTCHDVDECEEQNGGCSHACLNNNGSHSCNCPSGLKLAVDTKTCLDIDECGKENGGCSHQCSNHEGHYKCLCPAGTHLQKDGHTCQDIDECSTGKSGCSHKCNNIFGAYECLCPDGYMLDLNNHTCHDINECKWHNGRCEEQCHNTRGSFRCDCDSGYQLAADLRSCEDIDECEIANGGCSHFCENMSGSFSCNCPTGYKLDDDGFQCIDMDECRLKPCEHTCVNTDGSFYCSCDEGYSPRPDSADLCHDVNECEENNGGCTDDCFNTIGSYYCGCKPGFQLEPNSRSCVAKKVFCPLITASIESFMKCSAEPTGATYEAGTKCYFSCRNGLTINGEARLTCKPNGLWSNVIPTCKDILCPGVPNIEFGVITPYRCIQGTSKVNQHCYLTCNQGYRVIGNPVRTCKHPGAWIPAISSHCEKVESLKPFIQCPNDMAVVLAPHQNVAYVRLPQPKSNVDWYRTMNSESVATVGRNTRQRFIDSSHDWAKELEADIPAGSTIITFTARSPVSTEKATCSFEVFVKDTEIPQVFGCPKSFKIYLAKDEDAVQVTWKEPVFKDNVEVVHIYKSMEPRTKLEIGRHPVHYIAVDPQGNRAKCSFVVTVEEDLLLDEPTQQIVRRGNCGLQPGPIPGGLWVCNDWEWGRICKPNCPPSKVLINPSSNLLFMCVFSSGTWIPDATDIYSRPACSESVSVKRGLDCMLGYEREKTNPGACMACTPGMYRSKSFDRCVPCKVGYYSHTFGSSNCEQCPRRRITTNIGTYSRSLCVRRDVHIKRKRLSQAHFTRKTHPIYG